MSARFVPKRLPLTFRVGHTDHAGGTPAKLVPARVPGAVQLDWARAHDWAPHWHGGNPATYAWMEDAFWRYEATLAPPRLAPGERLHLVLAGVDYQFRVSLDGVVLHEQEGMFARVDLDLGAKVREGSVLAIEVAPAPKYPHAHRPKAQASRSCKPAVSYGWDFHPRLIPLGIWDDAYLEVRPAVAIERAALVTELAADLTRADVHARVHVVGTAHAVEWRIADPDGATVATCREPIDGRAQVELAATIASPRPWWPNGEGEQALYTSTFTLLDGQGERLHELRKRHGVRRVRLVMNGGAWHEPSTFPKGRSTPPITIEINGRRIFARGSNWVCPDIFPGAVGEDRYREQLTLARDAHFNLLRCWGGAAVNKDAFYDLCDELGLMVWQEFPLACNEYADEPAYLRVLEREARAIVTRLREHPCLALWCGGNELFNIWSGMTDQHLALRLLDAICLELDPRTPYLPTSPVMGMGHGDYRFRDDRGREAFQMFDDAGATAYTEFGCPGPASVETLRSFLPPDEVWPPRRGTAWETHHAYGAWMVAPSSWLFQDVIEDYFGPASSLEKLVELGQLMQAEGYKALFEEARRQKPRASMALNWCWNEPWPTAANNSLLSWPSRPKPAYHAVAASCRPTLASLKIPRFAWAQGDVLDVTLWLLHDGPAPLPGGHMHCALIADGREHPMLAWRFDDLPANTHLRGPTARLTLPALTGRVFELVATVDGRPELASRYRLCHRPRPPARPVFVLPGGDNNA